MFSFKEQGTIVPTTLVASAFIGFLSIAGILIIPVFTEPQAEMYLEPRIGVLQKNETFRVAVTIQSSIPVNVFGGELLFDNEVLAVESISYNTSVADLWAEKPWYDNGAGTLNFGGGTTQSGGFWGDGVLLTVTFKALREGTGSITIQNAALFKHDGLGTEATLETPIDALFTVESYTTKNVIAESKIGTQYYVNMKPPTTDLNGDGRQSIADISIFMLNITSNDPQYDFNQDGKVNTKDLSILMNAE